MTLRAILACLLLLTAVHAQPEGPQGPRQLFDTFFAEMKKAIREDDDEALTRAGHLFDLADVNRVDRDEIGRRAARDLLNYLNRLDAPVPTERMPTATTEPTYAYRTEHGTIVLERAPDGAWRFARSTRLEVAALYEQVADREARIGQGAYRDAETWLRDNMPAWLRRRVFLLQHWQWLGLLLLVLLGGIAGAIGRFAAMAAGSRAARRRGVTLESGRKVARPFGLVTMALVWLFGLSFLALPETAHFALKLCARVVLMAGVVWSLCRVVDWVAEIFEGMAQRTTSRLDDLLVPMVRRALKIFIVALGVVWIADNLDMDIAALLAGLGIGGVALALASKDTVENFFGALAILADRPFQVGDWIVMGNIEGTVTEVGFRSTRVRTFYNSLISFPNALLIRTAVDNLGAREYRRIKESIGVAYDTPPEKLEAFLEGIRELIRRHPYTRKDYFHVYFHRFGDSALEILLYLFVKTPDWATELRERQRFLTDVLRLARALGVEFAFPTQTLHVVQGAAATHEDAPGSVEQARRAGLHHARDIADRFTGRAVPPPVDIAARPDEAFDEGE